MTSELKSGLDALNLDYNSRKLDLLEKFAAEIMTWNTKYRLLASEKDLVKRHILDSLTGVSLVRRISPVSMADVGSGAGFPGIPLSFWFPEMSLHLVERSGRRADFLRYLVTILKLSNVRVLEMDAEKMKSSSHRYQMVTCRAWRPLNGNFFRTLSPLIVPGGVILVYKGRRDVVETEISSISGNVEWTEVIPVTVPGLEEERHMVLLCPKSER